MRRLTKRMSPERSVHVEAPACPVGTVDLVKPSRVERRVNEAVRANAALYSATCPLCVCVQDGEQQKRQRKLPAVWQLVKENQFGHRKRKAQDEDDIMICQCKPVWRGGDGCGPDCINRLLCIECVPVSTQPNAGLPAAWMPERACVAWARADVPPPPTHPRASAPVRTTALTRHFPRSSTQSWMWWV